MLKFIAGVVLALGLAASVTSAAAAPRDADCADCPVSKRYDSEEVIKRIRNIDRSRTINTTTVVPVDGRDDEPRRDVRRAAEPRHVIETKRSTQPSRAVETKRQAEPRRMTETRRSAAERSYNCVDCAPKRKYDSQEIKKNVRDIDRSRVINTRTVVPVGRRVKETNHLVIHQNETRETGVIQHNHTIIEKETRYVRRVPARTRVEFITHDYQVVERPATMTVPVSPVRVRGCGYGRGGYHGSCRSLLRVRG